MQAFQDFLQPVLNQVASVWNWSKGALYNILQWTTSWLYYAAGAGLGLTAGFNDALLRYWSTVATDALVWAGIQPPYHLRQAQEVHFGADTLHKVSRTVRECVPAAAPLVEGISPEPAGIPPTTKKVPDVATNVTNAVKQKPAKATEAVKRAPAAVPGVGSAARTAAAGGGPARTASTSVHMPGIEKPLDVSFTRV